MTNGDKIRNMTDEQIADVFELKDCFDRTIGYVCPRFLSKDVQCDCKSAFLEWLRKESDETKDK